jgi:hypothetical protein
MNIVAQTSEETVTVPKSMLTEDQKKVIAVKEVTEKLKDADDVNMIMAYGKAVGVAIDDGLSAVVKHADAFGKTQVGQFTMFMIAFKIMGPDVIQVIVGVLIWLIFTLVILYIRRKLTSPVKKITERTGIFKKKYEISPSPHEIWTENNNRSTDGPSPLTWTFIIWGLFSFILFLIILV